MGKRFYNEDTFELSENIEEIEEDFQDDDAVRAKINYGPIKRGAKLNIVKTGPDWYGVKHRGSVIVVPKYVVED